MSSRILAIDVATSGCAGNLLIHSLADVLAQLLQTPIAEIIQEYLDLFNEICNSNVSFTLQERIQYGFRGYNLEFQNEAIALQLEEQTLLLEKLITRLTQQWTITFAQDCWNLLLEAERDVHGADEIHLHELGFLDTILDIFGVSYFLDRIEPNKITLSPVAIGTGTISGSHGILPVPVPAVQYILENSGLKTLQTQIPTEVLTPTGAALLTCIRKSPHFVAVASVSWKLTGQAMGKKNLEDRVNQVRVRFGIESETVSNIIILESHLDDISAEHLGHLIDTLLQKDAADVSYSPLVMKKNRPGWLLRVITKPELADEHAEIIMQHTGTLGVRVQEVTRHIGQRAIQKVKVRIAGNIEEVMIKAGKFRKKIEFDDLVRLGIKYGLSPLQVEQQLIFEEEEVNE